MPDLYNPAAHFDLETHAANLVKRLGGTWSSKGAMCRCPAHDDRTPSLSIRVGEKALLFKCFAGCDTLDVIRAIRRLDRNISMGGEAAVSSSPTSLSPAWLRQRALRPMLSPQLGQAAGLHEGKEGD